MFWSKFKVDKKNTSPADKGASEPIGSTTTEVVPSPVIPQEVAPANPAPEVNPEVVVVSSPSVAAPTELEKGSSSTSVDTLDLESSSKYDEKCKKRESKMAEAVPGNEPPYEGPTIPSQPAVLEERPESSPTPPPVPKVDAPIPEPMVVEPTLTQEVEPMQVDTPEVEVPGLAEASTVPATLPQDPPPPAPTPVVTDPPSEALIAEFNKLTDRKLLAPMFARLEKMDQVEFDGKVRQVKEHPSLPQFEAYVCSIGCPGYKFGSDDLTHEIAVFTQWCRAESNIKNSVVETPPEPVAPPTPRVSALQSVLTRATTVDLAPSPPAEQRSVSFAETPAVAASTPAPVISSVFAVRIFSCPNFICYQVDPSVAPKASEGAKSQIMRNKKAKWHRSMRSSLSENYT